MATLAELHHFVDSSTEFEQTPIEHFVASTVEFATAVRTWAVVKGDLKIYSATLEIMERNNLVPARTEEMRQKVAQLKTKVEMLEFEISDVVDRISPEWKKLI